MDFRCTTEQYDTLYSRWLENPKDIFAGIEVAGKRVLDLCGGTGVVSRTALELGASNVTLLDVYPRCRIPGVKLILGRAESAMTWCYPEVYDLVVCRQALGYLDLPRVAWNVRNLLAEDGRFVFNNFRSPRWRHFSYEHRGRSYTETSGYVGKTVFHRQHCEGVGTDWSVFRWWKFNEIINILSPHFTVGWERGTRSYRFIAQAKAGSL
jgi:SAM-dependent methyltransferase